MAKQVIDIGSTANDGTGDTLRDAMTKANSNFTELYATDPTIIQKLYDTAGWGYYVDAETTPATQTISTTPSKLQIDSLGGLSDSSYLPNEIRGVSELWDATTNKVTPINIGDSYDVRVSLTITAKGGSPNVLVVILDIGGGATVTINISEYQIPVVSSVPFSATVSLPIFCLSTFKTNGGQLFLSTDAGTLTVSSRTIFIKRDYNGTI